jgi:hypothetical protein
VAALGVASQSNADPLLNGFEDPSEFAPTFGWHATPWESPPMAVSQDTGPGSTGGSTYNMRINANGRTNFAWAATGEYNVYPGGPPDAIQSNAVAQFNYWGDGRELQAWFEFDVTWIAAENPGGAWESVQMAINSANGWTQSPDNLATRQWGTNGFDIPVETYHVVTTPIGTWSGLGSNKLPNGDGQWFQIIMSLNANGDPNATVHIDNLVLVPEPACLGLLLLGATGMLRRRR